MKHLHQIISNNLHAHLFRDFFIITPAQKKKKTASLCGGGGGGVGQQVVVQWASFVLIDLSIDLFIFYPLWHL